MVVTVRDCSEVGELTHDPYSGKTVTVEVPSTLSKPPVIDPGDVEK